MCKHKDDSVGTMTTLKTHIENIYVCEETSNCEIISIFIHLFYVLLLSFDFFFPYTTRRLHVFTEIKMGGKRIFFFFFIRQFLVVVHSYLTVSLIHKYIHSW